MSNLTTLFSNVRESLARATARLAEIAFAGQALTPAPVPVSRGRRRGWTKKIAMIVPALALALPALASAGGYSNEDVRRFDRWDTVAEGRLVDVQIKVDGVAAPLFLAPDHSDRTYFEAFAGRSYSLVLHNRSSRRVGILLAVDGLNVVNGERTGLSSHEPMYVLDPWQQTEVRGWRTSLSQVRRFTFVDERRSYAERTGQANRDMGWIRVLAFNEARPMVWRPEWDKRERQFRDEPRSKTQELDSDEEPQAAAPEIEGMQKNSVPPTASRGQAFESDGRENGGSFPGTGWGEGRYDPVRRVNFTAASRPTDHLVFRYEYASGLRALGIFPRRNRLWERDGQVGFAKPPRW